MPEARSVNYVFPLLEEQNRSTCALLASRAAFRSIPFVANLDRKGYERQILYCFRALLIAFLGQHGTKIPAVEFEVISSSAAKRVDEIAFETAPDHYALRSAALACICSMENVNAADATANAIYNSSLAMAEHPLSPLELAYLAFDKDLLRPRNYTRIWHDLELTGTLQATHSHFVRILCDKTGPWRWWRAWYEQMWHGTFTDWDFALEVAKIDWDAAEGESVWDKGPAAVAARIDELKTRYPSETLPQVETITEDKDGNYVLGFVTGDATGLLETALRQLTFVLSECLGSNSCSLSSMCMAYKLLRYTLDECRDDPNAVEANFRMARSMILRKLENDEYVREDAIETLIQVLEDGALQLRADHPEVAAAVDSRAKRKLKELDDAKRQELAAEFQGMEEHTAGRLQSDYRMDADIVAAEPGSDAQAEAIKRGANRASRIGIMERAKKLESSGGMASTKIMLRVQSIIDIVLGLF